jgi:hypothetical protein
LDVETRQPLADVKVQRVNPERAQKQDQTMKGGQMMQDAPIVITTDAEGRFAVDSVRTLVVFRKIHLQPVDLSFQRAGYRQFTTNFVPASATVLPNGEPEVNAGDILLHRSP